MIGPSFFAFLLVIIIILIFSKYELSIVLMIAAVIFAFLAQVNIIESFTRVIINPSILFLAIAVLFIPILGSIMEESGLMLELIQKMKVSEFTYKRHIKNIRHKNGMKELGTLLEKFRPIL